MENDIDLIETGLIIDSAINQHLKETAGWAKFLAITGFVYCALIAIGGFSAAAMFTRLPGISGPNGAGLAAGAMVAFIYLVMAVVIFFMSLFLFKFATKTKEALPLNDQVMLTEALKQLKIYFRFAGIITAITLVFSMLGVIGIIIATAFRG